MDKALDEIITTTKRTRRPASGPRRGSAKAQVLGKPAPNPVARARMAVAATPAPGTHVAEKIVVSNLPQDVNEGHVRELFSKTIGPCKEVNLFYDANGRSKGSAAIRFARKGDALKAHALYDGKLIDNS